LYNVCDDPTPEAMEAYLTVHSSPWQTICQQLEVFQFSIASSPKGHQYCEVEWALWYVATCCLVAKNPCS